MILQDKIEHLMQELEAAGKRATPQRFAVCQALVEHGGHPTVADVFERVRQTVPMISQATVYNTVDTLEELGLIQRLDIANHGHVHYDLDVKPHVNVVCRHCEYIADVTIDALDHLLDEVSERTGSEIDRHAGLIVYGACPACRAAGKTAALDTHSKPCPTPMRKHGKGHCRRSGGGAHARRNSQGE
jgi:Fur family transcriptional regulator, peroxide stress response regulator